MSRLIVRCELCGTRFAMRDNGYENPALWTWCPRCGSDSIVSTTRQKNIFERLKRPERPEAAA
jgi:transcription elongation factor Elf1